MRLNDIKTLVSTDEDGVSPVIGVILMIAVTVIMGAVIAGFVMGMEDRMSSGAPNAQFNFEAADDAQYGTAGDGNYYVEITHDGGDDITDDATKNLVIQNQANGQRTLWVADNGKAVSTYPLATGDSIVVGQGGDTDGDTATTDLATANEGQDLKVIWTAENDQSSQTLSQYTV